MVSSVLFVSIIKLPGTSEVSANSGKSYFNSILKTSVMLVKGTSIGYSSHCLRIGSATNCLMLGYSKDQISKMGRWKSDAVSKYLRVESFTVR